MKEGRGMKNTQKITEEEIKAVEKICNRNILELYIRRVFKG